MRRLSRSPLVYTALIVTAMTLLSAHGAQAAQLYATSYDTVNGAISTYDYCDFTYLPDPLNIANVSGSSLSGGLGKLTDGFVATGNWSDYGNLTPYVGWLNMNPEINFHFAGSVSVNQVAIHVDSYTQYVLYPASVAIQMGTTTDTFTISSDSLSGPNWFYFPTPGLSGNTLELTLGENNGEWIMLDEVRFFGSPVPLPPGLLLMGTGLVGLVGWRRLRKS
ncbi:MAG: hypothetical protein ACLQED_04905 [Desulfobaccales bacterium]